MAITNIRVSNFKSFKDLDLDLGRFNVVIGANASGKSNFVEIFRFLKTLEREELADAISLHGGSDAVANRRLGCAHPLRMSTTSDQPMSWAGLLGSLQSHENTYDFSLRLASPPRNGLLIEGDRLTQRFRLPGSDRSAEVTLSVFASEGKPRVDIHPPDILDQGESCFAASGDYLMTLKPLVESRSLGTSLLIRHGFFRLVGPSENLFSGVAIFDIDPRAIKRPHETAGIPRLEENGENLSLVLKQILADPERSRKLHNLLQYMLPFAKEVGVEQYLGVSLLLKLREEYYDDSLLADLLSDGTVDVVALIIALFFEDNDVVIIEEPERNLHPHLISGLMRLMEDASTNKQVIITTHSSEIVKHAGVENLLLISRDKDGFSAVSRPAEKQDVKVFLENDLGLDTVFVQELWGR
ncbi:MAG TPA: AAA family ATPase [Sedimentisphaerales bacterium]|jgi:energy-coupling factor transporter ATP-binding protein EcfA2|nr:AAA family ATPase [Sedimentisphaerales bacterium]HNU27593.1 AAA family ATPase [Sedimentisphaerales bacterium]